MAKRIFRTFRTICTALLLFSACLVLTCCGGKMTDAQIGSIARPLIEKSYEVNEIFFGKGLPFDEELRELYLEEPPEDIDVKEVRYIPVSPDCEYAYIETIKDAAYAVYTADYCDSNLFPVAFNGLDDGEGGVLQYARFIENEYGVLTQRSDVAQTSVLTGRTYDFDTVKCVKQGSGYVIFTVSSYVDGKASDVVRITMKKEASGWRLDTPTY